MGELIKKSWKLWTGREAEMLLCTSGFFRGFSASQPKPWSCNRHRPGGSVEGFLEIELELGGHPALTACCRMKRAVDEAMCLVPLIQSVVLEQNLSLCHQTKHFIQVLLLLGFVAVTGKMFPCPQILHLLSSSA